MLSFVFLALAFVAASGQKGYGAEVFEFDPLLNDVTEEEEDLSLEAKSRIEQATAAVRGGIEVGAEVSLEDVDRIYASFLAQPEGRGPSWDTMLDLLELFQAADDNAEARLTELLEQASPGVVPSPLQFESLPDFTRGVAATRGYKREGARVLSMTYNFGAMTDRSEIINVEMGIVERIWKESPDIIMLASQEIRRNYIAHPLRYAVESLPDSYTWVGSSYIVGMTKVNSRDVYTLVEVAVRNDLLEQVSSIVATHCPRKWYGKELCKKLLGKGTFGRFYSRTVKATKGYVVVALNFKPLGLYFQFFGVHLDTEEWTDNLKDLAPILTKPSSKRVVRVVAGDFNIRFPKSHFEEHCIRDGGYYVTPGELQKLLAAGHGNSVPGDEVFGQALNNFRLRAAGAVDRGATVANFAPPALAEHNGVAVALPTYKFDVATNDLDVDQLLDGWNALFLKRHVCDGKLGVLDRVVEVHDSSQYEVRFANDTGWAFFKGTDHAMTTSVLTAKRAQVRSGLPEDERSPVVKRKKNLLDKLTAGRHSAASFMSKVKGKLHKHKKQHKHKPLEDDDASTDDDLRSF